jgi:hypothetical protein
VPEDYPSAGNGNSNTVDYRVVMNQRSAPRRDPEEQKYMNNYSVDFRLVMNAPAAPASSSGAKMQLAALNTGRGAPVRAAVQNSIAALRAMPPGARQRQLNSGRYSAFTEKEREVLNLAIQPAQVQ